MYSRTKIIIIKEKKMVPNRQIGFVAIYLIELRVNRWTRRKLVWKYFLATRAGNKPPPAFLPFSFTRSWIRETIASLPPFSSLFLSLLSLFVFIVLRFTFPFLRKIITLLFSTIRALFLFLLLIIFPEKINRISFQNPRRNVNFHNITFTLIIAL